MRAASAMRSSPSGSGLTPRLGLEPETITVSDDEDEPPMALVKKHSGKVEAVPDFLPPKELKCETPLDCSSKTTTTPTTFVPYRESLSSPSLPSTSSLPSNSSFMPSFSVAALSKTEVKLEQLEMVKPEIVEAYHPPADDCRQSPANIKEEPKDDFHLEVGEEVPQETADKVPVVATPGVAESVKEEKRDDSTTLAMEEAADLLLSLADMVDPPRKSETIVKEEDIEEIERSDFDGLDLLLEGISLHLKNNVSWSPGFSFSPGLEMLYAVTREDASTFGIGDDLSVLCAVTEEDYFNYLNWVDPMIELKRRYNLHNYKCENSQDLCKQFISAKIKKFKKLNEGQNENDDSPRIAGMESLDEVIKKIKNTDIMSQLEVELRSQLAQLQDLYKDKQKEMSRLKSSPKKMTPGAQSSSRSRTRGPGRPKKRCLKSNAKTKMGRPRKRRHSEEDEYNEEEDEDEEEEEEESNNLSPPVLKPWSISSRSPSPPPLFRHTNEELVAKKPVPSLTTTSTTTTGGLLKPPKLTASFSPAIGVAKKSSNAVTNLSTLNARFMKGKANPFQNLMKLATVPSGPGNSKEADDDDDDDEEEERESGSSTDDDEEENRKLLSSSKHVEASKESAESGCDRKYSDPEDGSASKRRKCEKPKRHCGSTETIVSKQPKNLFMMNCMTIQRGFSDKPISTTTTTTTTTTTVKSSTAVIDEYDFRDNDDDDEMEDADEDERWSLQSSSKNKMFTQYRDPVQPSPPPPPPTATLPRTKPLWSPASITKPSQPKASSLSVTFLLYLSYFQQQKTRVIMLF